MQVQKEMAAIQAASEEEMFRRDRGEYLEVDIWRRIFRGSPRQISTEESRVISNNEKISELRALVRERKSS
jgi:hypothetical protein